MSSRRALARCKWQLSGLTCLVAAGLGLVIAPCATWASDLFLIPARHGQTAWVAQAPVQEAEVAQRLKTLLEEANKLEAAGEIQQAISRWEQALAPLEKVLGPRHPATASALNKLAVLLEDRGRYKDAEPLYKRSLAIREKALGPEHPDTATSLNNLASLYISQSRYLEAEPLIRRSLAIREKALGAEHPDTANNLNKLAFLYQDQGRYEDAEPLYKRSLAIREKALGREHPDTASSLDNLASLYRAEGRHGEAESLYKRSLAIREKILGSEHADTADSLNNLALLYDTQGRYAEAESLYERSLAITEKALGPEHRSTATILNNLGALYRIQGRYREAEQLLKRSLAINEKLLGPEHPDTATDLNNLATLYVGQGRYQEAESLHKRSLVIREQVLGAEHLDTAVSISNLALLYDTQGRYAEAESHYKRSLAIREKVLGAEHPDTANSLNNLGSLYRDQGRSREAEVLLKRSQAIIEKMMGPDHPYTALTLNNLAASFLLDANSSSAAPLTVRLNQTQADWLRRELPLQPREFRSRLLAAQTDGVATSFALLDLDPTSAPLALETRLNRQGLLAEIEQRQRLLLGSTPQTRQLGERLAALDRQLASVSLSPAQRAGLGSQRQQLEGELNRLLPALRIEAVSTSKVAAALKALAPQGLLVEFQKYLPLKRDSSGKPQWGDPRYVALLLDPAGRIVAVPFGSAAPIDQAIARAHDASAANQADASSLWAQVSVLLLNPLQPHLAGVRELFLSPDGELNRIPFAALPARDGSSQLLSEALQLRILTTGRDLVRLKTPTPTGAAAPAVMANPQFDARARRSVPGSGSTAGTPATTRQQRSAAQQAGRRQWVPLPATEKEAQVLAPLLKANKPITGEAATESRALALQSPRILHIASHGFFDPEQPAEGKPKQAGGQLLGEANPSPLAEDPLLRSGIVLAGANNPDADPDDDGYLTAAEVTGMDLRHTELVTLSACETGLGSVRSGEGVYGLQRALTVAGSRSTLLSLWKVDDAATADFMAEFYRRLMAGEGRADALRNTQVAFRQHSNEGYRDVYVWGAFQLTGDWRPLSAR